MKPLLKTVILFFVREGLASDDHKAKAAEIAAKHGARVSFRNCSVGGSGSTDFLEVCDGVCGVVPSNYADRYPRVSLKTLEFDSSDVKADVVQKEKVEAFQAPKTVEGCRKALEAAGVDFHPKAKLPALQALFREAVAKAVAAGAANADDAAGTADRADKDAASEGSDKDNDGEGTGEG